MNKETVEKIRNAASLACTLRCLLEEIEQDVKEQDCNEVAWDFEDMADMVGQVEGDLDALWSPYCEPDWSK